MSFLVQNFLLVSLVTTGCAAVFALGGRSLIFHKMAQGFLIVSGATGIAASLQVLLSPQTVLTLGIGRSSFFAPLQLDMFSSIFFFILSLVSLLCAIYAIPYLASYHKTYHLPSLNALTAFFVFGMQLVILAHSPLVFMLGWELMSIASFFLVVSDRSHESVKAALLYLVMTHLGAAALFAGFLLLSQGSLLADFTGLAFLATSAPSWVLVLCFGLFFFGFGSKAGLVPFHVWLPEAHPAAPSHISALMSGVMLKVAVYSFLRVLLFVLPPISPAASLFILGFGLLSALYGVLYAVVERDFKRTLAFSSIENIGLIFTMLGIAFFAGSKGQGSLYLTALVAAMFFVIAHAIFKSGLFLASGVVVRAVHSRNLEKMGGLAKRLPAFSQLFCVLCLAAASLPPFGPFFGEWMFFQSLFPYLSSPDVFVRAVTILTFVVVALVGGLAIFGMVKLFAISMLGEPRSEQATSVHEQPRAGELLSIFVFSLLVVLLGVYAPSVLSLIGAQVLAPSFSQIVIGSQVIEPSMILWLLLGCVSVVWIVQHFVNRGQHEREYHTWDCGQPVDASMEYTATAFSAPIRFFFRVMLRTKKIVTSHAVVVTNPWIATRRVSVDLRSIWMDWGYTPIGNALIAVALHVKRIQSGNIRFYIFLMFLTLILTLWIAL